MLAPCGAEIVFSSIHQPLLTIQRLKQIISNSRHQLMAPAAVREEPCPGLSCVDLPTRGC